MIRSGRVAHKSACWRRRIVHRSIVGMLLASPVASAHFVLQSPASWMSQDSSGNPQKLGPCGDEGGGTPTASVTTFAPGETITITLKETVFHPGHYRVALAESRDELPAEPEVTAGTTPCGSVPIDPSPAFPVLADGALLHTSAFLGPQSIKVTLPSDVTCTHCTLQVIEFMSNHGLNKPGGCFYHHCADIAIQPNGGGAPGTGGSASFGGSTFRASGGTTAGTGGRASTPVGGSSSSTGGVTTGGRQASTTGGEASGGTQSLTGGTSASIGSGGTSPMSGGTSARTDGSLALGGTAAETGGSPQGTGGTNPLGTGGSGAAGESSGVLQSGGTAANSGGTLAATTLAGTAGTRVNSTTPDGQQASGCSCSIPGASRGSWLSALLLTGLTLLRARKKARPVSRKAHR